jgi:hypothetical protein
LVIAVAALIASICCVSAQAANPTISWLVNREPRGQAVPHSLLQGQSVKVKFLYERLITFDATAGMKMVVSLREGAEPFGTPLPARQSPPSTEWICFVAWAPHSTGTSCQSKAMAFTGGPLEFGVGGITGDSSVHGVASDNVKRIMVTLTSGKQLAVPLKNNAFLLYLPTTETLARITAYNALGKVIVSKKA